MTALRDKISEKLQDLPEVNLQEALDFIEFLIWKGNKTRAANSQTENAVVTHEDRAWLETDWSNLGSYEPYDWQPGEREVGAAVTVVPGERIFIEG